MSARDYGTIIQIGDVLVSEDVIMEYFACDYPVCKGCCCVIGDSGAPLKEEELELLERDYPVYSDLMSERGKQAVKEKGFFEIDRDGDLVTPVAGGTEECEITHFSSDGSLICSIEKCFFQGKCRFQKPISCRLYPIRVVDLGGGKVGLNLHRWNICKDAFEKGRREGIRVYEFLKEPLIDAYGEEFYSALCEAARMLMAAS